jgi:hypothetical protein
MGFIKRSKRSNVRDAGVRKGKSSFEDVSEAQMEEHLAIGRYGSFVLTDAIRPSYDLQVVPIETRHETDGRRHQDLTRESIDLPILKSLLFDYEDLLLNDGCTGIAVLNPSIPLEVQFDEHKLLVLYGHDLEPFEAGLEEHRLQPSDTIRFITEGEHVHSSSEEYIEKFAELQCRLGVED